MAAPTWYSKYPFFYPIGNTPPVCLTQNLAPEISADILLLGCGDPRNILETVHFDLGHGTRKLDFTCCDLETGVLARNVLLLSAIADEISWQNTWDIFFHFFIDDTSLEILLSQCRKLVHFSQDPTTWNLSSYGKFIRFSTDETMIEVRRQWELYLETNSLSKKEKHALRKTFVSHMTKIREKYGEGVDLSMFGAAGPINQKASIAAGMPVFRSFWKNGFIKGSTTRVTIPLHVNPTFVHSLAGSEFNIHYRTNPLFVFHLSPALSPIKGCPPRSSQITEPDFVDAAMAQFSTWCASFCARVKAKNPSIMIRFFAGDCMSFCHALRRFRLDKITKTDGYSRSWGLTQITFTEDYANSSAPLFFNNINTSNLVDHIGFLNLVLVTLPLLQRNPWSILQTTTFESSTSDKTMGTALVDRMFGDIPTLAVFLGVAPSFHVHSCYTDSGRRNDQITMDIVEDGRFHQSITWKRPCSVVPYLAPTHPEIEEPPLLVCDELFLAKFLFSVYMEMFSEENTTKLVNKTLTTYKNKNIHYIRTSFVEFICLIKKCVQADWTKAMELLVDLLEVDKTLLLGMNNYQDLICQFYLYGLYTIDTLRWGKVALMKSPGDSFDGWQDVPPVVSVVLVVPRQHLKVLEESDRMDIGVPILYCDTRGKNGQNMHSSIHLTFGDVIYSGQYADARVDITEDPAGWRGKSPMILSFDAASWLFTKLGGVQSVGLCLRASPCNTRRLFTKFGLTPYIFSAPLTDKKHVFITRHRPNDSRDLYRPIDNTLSTKAQTRSPVISLNFNATATRIESLAIRNSIVDQEAARTLASGVPISTKTIGDATVLASFPGFSQLFHFPFPIDTNKVKTKIARKSLYIEIVAPLRREIESPAAASLNLFPIARTTTSLNLLNVSYLRLSILPTLRLPLASENQQSLSFHLLLTLSDQERAKHQSKAPIEQKGMLVNLKESISTILLESAKLGVPQMFELSNPTLGTYTLIFVNDLKLDLTSQTVVADACVIPLTKKNLDKVIETVKRRSKWTKTELHTLDDEMGIWKCLLPAFVERCRTWHHTDMCEYRKKGIPAYSADVTWDETNSPLCSCGLGKDLGAFGALDEWKALRTEATRAAISALFPLLPLQKLQNFATQDVGKTLDVRCADCGGVGRPKLLACGRCRKIQYCSQKCQKAHWRQHKANCVMEK